ncbi:MAG: MFS transporter, partial [Holosporaceae bacterium]|nr:MFS transporter [Holosporaceae bacterium]
SFWLKDAGVSNSVIGAFSFFHWPFTFKFVWGVFIENYDIPYLSKKIGRNCSWVVAGYLILIAGVIGMSFSDPKSCLLQLMFFASLTALGDGCKGVALYPYQIDGITKDRSGYVAGAVGFGQKIGMILTRTGTLYLACFFGWKIAYLFAAAAIFLQMVAVLFLRVPPEHIVDNQSKSLKAVFRDSVNKSLVVGFRNFLKNKTGIHFLSILLFYKSIDFMMQGMSRMFLTEIGFSKIEIANAQLLGAGVVIVGGLIGGYIIKKIGLTRAMFYFGVAHAISFFFYVILLHTGTVLPILDFVIACEAFSGGCATTAFIATFYSMCKTGSMYALFWAIHETGGVFFGGISGVISDCIGWSLYFSLIPLIYLSVILYLYRYKKSIEFRQDPARLTVY